MPIGLANADDDRELFGLTNRIIGAAIKVHRVLGPGFAERVCQNALSCELDSRSIRHECEQEHPVRCEGSVVGIGRADILAEGQVILELKSVEALKPLHTTQLLAYLKAARLKVGLILNFNVRVMKRGIKRVQFG